MMISLDILGLDVGVLILGKYIIWYLGFCVGGLPGWWWEYVYVFILFNKWGGLTLLLLLLIYFGFFVDIIIIMQQINLLI